MSGVEALLRPFVYPAPPVVVPVAPPPFLESVLHLADGTSIVAWSLSAPTSAQVRPVALFLHGNGENLETLRQCGVFERLLWAGADVMAIDYPGYGRSGGEPSEESLVLSADAAFRHLDQLEAARRPRLVVGFSLGAAVAVQVAARYPDAVDGLVLLAAWTRLADLAAAHYPDWMARQVPPEVYDSLGAAERVAVPTLVVHGEEDEIIPLAQGRELVAALPFGSRLLVVPGRGHNDLLADQRLWSAVAEDIAQLGRP